MSNFRLNQNPPPLSLIPKSRVISKKSVGTKSSKANSKTSSSAVATSAILKPYKQSITPIFAPAPFFSSGRLNSLPASLISSEEVDLQSASIVANPANDEAEAHDKDTLVNVKSIDAKEMVGNAETLGCPTEYIEYNDDFGDMVVETADKANQTDCQCGCVCGNQKPASDLQLVSNRQLTREVAKLGYIVRDVASKITGKQTIDMSKFFPIKEIADLQTIQNHIDKSENFLLKLDMYLKDLIPANSTAISFGLRQLVTDRFLYGKNWDGRNAASLKVYGFFNSILFDSWKSANLTKMVYVQLMRSEIKKAHDRHYRTLKSDKNNL